jgi:hypothetical protein
MSPQNVLSVRSVSSVSVVILIWRLCQNIISGYHTALNKQKPTSHDKLLMAPQIKHDCESIHPAPQHLQSQYWCNHKTVKNKIMQQNSKGI